MGCFSSRSTEEKVVIDFFAGLPIRDVSTKDFAKFVSEIKDRETESFEAQYKLIHDKFIALPKEHSNHNAANDLFNGASLLATKENKFDYFLWGLLLLCKIDKTSFVESSSLLFFKENNDTTLRAETVFNTKENKVQFSAVQDLVSRFLNLVSTHSIEYLTQLAASDKKEEFGKNLERLFDASLHEKVVANVFEMRKADSKEEHEKLDAIVSLYDSKKFNEENLRSDLSTLAHEKIIKEDMEKKIKEEEQKKEEEAKKKAEEEAKKGIKKVEEKVEEKLGGDDKNKE